MKKKYAITTTLKRCLLGLGLLAVMPVARAADYYWVPTGTGATRTGTGAWNELGHWAASSGGAGGVYAQVPRSTDDVYFDDNSFTASNQRVSVTFSTSGAPSSSTSVATCHDLIWRGAVRSASFSGTNSIEVNGDIRLTTSMAAVANGVVFRLLADEPGHVIDLQNVLLQGSISRPVITFANANGGWTFTSTANLNRTSPIQISAAQRVSLGNSTLTCGQFMATGTNTTILDLGSSSINILFSNNGWVVQNPNLTLVPGSSTINLGSLTSTTASTNVYDFISTTLPYHDVVVAAGTLTMFSVANSSFDNVTATTSLTFTSAATINPNGRLTVGRDAVLRVGSGPANRLTFGSGATLTTGGSCAGLAQLQASTVGTAAILARSGGWASAPIGYATVQDLTFTDGNAANTANGAAIVTNGADRGNNAGVSIAALPVSDLYWVGGSGNWHDASHWALSSGGTAPGTGCLPNLRTNVRFDANSFPVAGGRVTLDDVGGACRNMDWTGVANAPTFAGVADVVQRPLFVGGSLTLATDMTLTLASDIHLLGQEAGSANTLTTAGKVLVGNLLFRAPGSAYTLRDALTLAPAANSVVGRIYLEAGTLNTNNQDIAARGFSTGYAFGGSVFATGTNIIISGVSTNGAISRAAVELSLGSSVLNLTPSNNNSDSGGRTVHVWDITAPAQFNAGTSVINIINNVYLQYFVGGQGKTYATVNFTGPVTTVQPVIRSIGTTSTFGVLTFVGSANIQNNNSITGRLQLAAGQSYNFNSTTQTFVGTGQLNALGTCGSYVSIFGNASTNVNSRANFSAAAGNSQILQYVRLINTTFKGGATWVAQPGADNGGNTGITISSTPSRTLYWVGNGGNWSDEAHWSLSSGGSGGACIPSQFDDVIVDAGSFTLTGQTLTQDLATATCRSLSWSAVTNQPTFSSALSPTINNALNVYGSVTFAPPSRMTLALNGDLVFLASGTLTSAGQTIGGSVTLNAPGGSLDLADALLQNNNITNPIVGLQLLAGTLNTNDQPVTTRTFTTSGSATRVLNLGTSRVEVTYFMWNIPASATLTLNAGTSTIVLNTTQTGGGFGNFVGGNYTYNKVLLNSYIHQLEGNNTFAELDIQGSTTVLGNNTIIDRLTLAAGRTYSFAAGSTTTFRAATIVQALGAGNQVVTLQSSVTGSQFIWTKPAGQVCADYVYIRDSRVTGGAYYEGGGKANNQANNVGWSFAFVPQVAYQGRLMCPNEGAHTMRFTFTAFDNNTNTVSNLAAAQYPLEMVLNNLTTGASETLTISGPTYDYAIPTSTASANYQVGSISTSPTSCGAIVNNGPFPIAADAVLSGAPGTWTGTSRAANSDWFDCQNWASGTIPTTADDVIIDVLNPAISIGSGFTVAAGINPSLTTSGGQARNLQVASGSTLVVGSAAELAVAGNWLNSGTVTVHPASLVTFNGASTQRIANASLGRVVVNNTGGGLSLQSDASSATSLTLTAGVITTGSFRWLHTNAAVGSFSGYGANRYVAGTLRRAITPGTTATYAFPVGTPSQYALLELDDNGLAGTTFLEAKFGPKPGTDAGLNYAEPGSNVQYQSIHNAGVWTITPDTQPSAGRYDARLFLAPFSGLIDNRFAILKRPDASSNAADWNNGGGTINPDGGAGRRVSQGYALRKNLNSFSQFALGLANNSPLPVVLVTFQATAQGSDALLGWTTALEANISAYEVQRSLDGSTFVPVGQVPAQTGATHNYFFRDAEAGLVAGAQPLYYRLRIIESGAAPAYGPVAAVRFGMAPNLVAWPSPFGHALSVSFTALPEAVRSVELLDAQGRRVRYQAIETGTGSTTLSGQGLPSGLYLLRVGTASQVYVRRVMRE